MKRTLILAFFSLVLFSCHSLPEITPTGHTARSNGTDCDAVYPRQPWRMVHTIKTAFPGRHEGVMVGVVALEPETKTVECALLSIEGLRLFEAHDDGHLTVRRALPPFDRPSLAEGMMADIRLLFFAPDRPPLVNGTLPSGNQVCRYACPDGYLDVMPRTADGVDLKRYDRHFRLTRQVTITRCHPEGAPGKEPIPCRIRLEAFHPAEYRLDLELIEARPEVDNPSKAY